MPFKQRLLALFLLLFFAIPSSLIAQINNSTLTVYIDCRGCDDDFVRSEVNYVNFVRDQSVAEVQLLVTLQRTGGGGFQFTLDYIGLGEFEGKDNTILFISPQSDTDELMRNRLVKYVKLGLVNYLSEKDIITDLEVFYVGSNETGASSSEEITDPWNGWNFELGANANLSGEQSRENYRLNGSFEAQRTTENWKVRFDYWQNYNKRVFISTDSLGNEEREEFTTEEQNVFGLVGRSLSDHWTIGSYFRGQSSTQNNIDLRIAATPTIEFSLFPYSEFNRRAITIRYGMLAEQNFYSDTTIFGESEEFLFRQELNIEAEYTQPWGGIDGEIRLGNYMHDFSKNRLNFNLRVNMRVSRIFSFNVSGRYSVINDQLSIPAGDFSDAEILLNLRNQATSYNFGASFGFEINFGSVYNNVVNSRL
ncbi:MAG: hypothetical protein RIC57_00845 [Balneola sp.]|tara:strand:+ start:49691 stop:50953 length:1263 start_codon:yes stop_codon:yes gene_type:complete